MRKNWFEPDWPVPATVHAAATTRTGGVSQGCFAGFNLASHVGDDPQQVQQNRALLKLQLALPGDPVWLEQVHGNTVLKADLVQRVMPADAGFTDQAGVVCAVLTADCLPVLFCSADAQVVAAAHAGWRGLLAGVLSNTYHAMQQPSVIAWLGPAIGPGSFEVGTEVRDAFVNKNAQFADAFVKRNAGHYLADIYQLAGIELLTCGVSQVYGGGFCTFSESERFFSYRRENRTGRMATLIWRD